MSVVPDAELWELERRLVDFVQFITIFLVYFVSMVSVYCGVIRCVFFVWLSV
jgi:hypothetical protein